MNTQCQQQWYNDDSSTYRQGLSNGFKEKCPIYRKITLLTDSEHAGKQTSRSE